MIQKEVRGNREYLTDNHCKSIRIATTWLETLGRGDMEGVIKLWHREGVLEFPFNPPDAGPERIVGIDDLGRYFRGTEGYKQPLSFPVKAIYPCADPEWLVIEFTGNLINTKTDQTYSNEYVVVVRVSEGKVILFREFFDSLKRKQHELG